MIARKADLIQHPRSPVTFDPPTEESIARAIAAAEAERTEIIRYNRLRDDDKLELSRMVDLHGWEQVSRWLMGLQAIHDDLRRG
jgi:hypothetical protein